MWMITDILRVIPQGAAADVVDTDRTAMQMLLEFELVVWTEA